MQNKRNPIKKLHTKYSSLGKNLLWGYTRGHPLPGRSRGISPDGSIPGISPYFSPGGGISEDILFCKNSLIDVLALFLSQGIPKNGDMLG